MKCSFRTNTESVVKSCNLSLNNTVVFIDRNVKSDKIKFAFICANKTQRTIITNKLSVIYPNRKIRVCQSTFNPYVRYSGLSISVSHNEGERI